MSYSQTLEVLGRLHLDARFRAAFRQAPAAALEGLALREDERGRLARLDPLAVERAGRMMESHRQGRIREQVEWLAPERRPGLQAVLERYLSDTLPALLNREEALAFCRYLEGAPGALPRYVPELARFERLRLSMAWGLEPSMGESHVARFAFPVLRILDALAAPGWPQVEPETSEVALTKVPGLPAVLFSTSLHG